MFRSRATLGAMLAVALAIPAAGSAAADGPIAHVACTQAKIEGKSKCIARGQFCARAHARDYRRYGLSCTKRDVNGRYHLE